jgi:hypothetical protein
LPACPLSEEFEFGADLDRSLEATRDRTEAGVEPVDSLDLLSALGGSCEPVANRNALDHEHAIVGLDLAERFDVVLLGVNFDLTRLQRAGKGAGQSPSGCGNNVVQRRRVRRVRSRVHAVVLGDFGMHAERHGIRLGWEYASRCGPPSRLIFTREMYEIAATARGKLLVRAAPVHPPGAPLPAPPGEMAGLLPLSTTVVNRAQQEWIGVPHLTRAGGLDAARQAAPRRSTSTWRIKGSRSNASLQSSSVR